MPPFFCPEAIILSKSTLPEPGRLAEAETHRLVLAIRSATGIEALVWLTDVGGLSRADAAELMRWSAQALLHAALNANPPPI